MNSPVWNLRRVYLLEMNSLARYLNVTFLVGTMRAAAIMCTVKYSNGDEKKLITDNIGRCVANGTTYPLFWPIYMYTDMRLLEVYLRNKNPDDYNASFFLWYD